MILRAKVKAVEHISPEAICCARMREHIVASAGSVFQVLPRKRKKAWCPYCKAKFRGIGVFGITGWAIDPRCFDIEEGLSHGSSR